MSRIGQKPIEIPDKVKVTLGDGNTVAVKGPLGDLSMQAHPDLAIQVQDGAIIVTRPTDGRQHRALHGLTRALIANMVQGVTEGFEKRLLLRGVGYRAEVNGNKLTLRVGYSHTVEMEAPAGISFEVADNTTVVVRGADKQAVGQTAADVRAVRPVEPYRLRGIRYIDERVPRKAGKTRAGD
ncbi:MAG TPA: 50S ribosomal protein L6 [Armatimonadetes bacterium]|jgi:large subunit ribosomal protein L6|nr:50S ribosomal protein L6 [Armatimonadota bacterium]